MIVGGNDLDYKSSVGVYIYRDDNKNPITEDYTSEYGDGLVSQHYFQVKYKDKVVIEFEPSEAHKIAYVTVDGEDVILEDNKLTLNLNTYPESDNNYNFYDIVVYFQMIRETYLEKPTTTILQEIQIKTAKELRYVAAMANNGESFKGKTIKLMNDIDMENINFTGIATGGVKGVEFDGTFDGGGYEIKNMRINLYNVDSFANFLNASFNHNMGLIGMLGTNGIVRNVTVSGGVNGVLMAGGIVGVNYGTIKNVVNNASVKGIAYVGGIVGLNDNGTVADDCKNNGTVTILFK